MVEGETEKQMAEAMAHHRAGRINQAASLYLKVLKTNRANSKALHLLGTVAYEQQNHDDAAFLIEKAITIDPEIPIYYYDLALVLMAQGDLKAAEKTLEASILLSPKFADAHNLLGNIYNKQGRMEKAIERYELCLCLKPDSAMFWFNLGIACKKLTQLDKAIESFKKAVHFKNDYFQAYNNLGNVYREIGAFSEAIKNFDRALNCNPEYTEALFNRSLVLLGMGDYVNGWKGFDQRLQVPDFQPCCPESNGVPKWNGCAFQGKELFVWDEQGFGDTLQFVRYLPLVKALGGTVTLQTDKTLINLLCNAPGIDRLIEKPETGKRKVRGDYHVSLLSLPGIFGTTVGSIPNKVPYLFADTLKSKQWKSEFGNGALKIGLVWSGNPGHGNDRNRSCELIRFAPLAHVPNIRLFGLQKGEAVRQIHTLPGDFQLLDLDSEIKNWSDTAAIIDNLDLIISVDTSVAHLAGAMGKRVWVLIPKHLSDWRWLLDREDSPWYPTMRLFRQQKRGDWDSVIVRLADRLSSSNPYQL